MLKALPTRLLDFVTGGTAGAATRPLAGGPAPTTPILLGDIRNLPGTGQPSTLPIGPRPTPPAWPTPPAPQPAPQPTFNWPWQPQPRPQPQPNRPQPPYVPGPQPYPGDAGSRVAQVFGAIASVGLGIFQGVMGIIDWFKARKDARKRGQQPPPPAPIPIPDAPRWAGTVQTVDPRVAQVLAEANRAIAAVADAIARFERQRAQAVQAGGPGNIVGFGRPADRAPAPLAQPVPDDRQRLLAQILAQLTALLGTLTALLEKTRAPQAT